MAKNKGEPLKKEVSTMLKCLSGVIEMANRYGYEATSNMMQRVIVTEKSVVRKRLICLIMDEISRKYMITPNELRAGTHYVYDIPRWIAYYMMYLHADMSIKEIALYFEKSYVWINKKIKDFKKLDYNNSVDKKILDVYDFIYKNVCERVAKIESKEKQQEPLKDNSDEF